MDPTQETLTALRRRVRLLRSLATASFAVALFIIGIAPFLGGRLLQSGAILAALVSALGFVIWTKSRDLQRELGLAELLVRATKDDD